MKKIILSILFLGIAPAHAEVKNYDDLSETEKKEAAQAWYESLERAEKRKVESSKRAYQNIIRDLEKLMASMNESERLYIVHGDAAEE